MADKIEVKYIPIVKNGIILTTPHGDQMYHKVIVYTKDVGEVTQSQRAIRFGPDMDSDLKKPLGYLKGYETSYDESHMDWSETAPTETIATGTDLSAEWNQMKVTMQQINDSDIIYFPKSTSNTGVDEIARRVNTTNYPDGLNEPVNDDRGENFSPGSGYPLPISAPPAPSPTRTLPERLNAIKMAIDEAVDRASPLVLDLDHSGTIELVSLANSTTYWDGDVNGFVNLSGWATGGDGFLAYDINSNGLIDNNSELFGTMEIDGFTVLAQYDSNADGQITAEDTIWNDLIIWIDANEDGYSNDTELYTLGDHGIIAINLGAAEVNITNQGHAISHTSTFTVDTGSGTANYAIHDVWFNYDSLNSFYALPYEAQEAIYYMPTMRGYGELPSLHISMSMDYEGSGSLLNKVYNLFSTTVGDIFSFDDSIVNDVRDILFRWAGVDGLNGDERGDFVDSRELGFLEKLTGDAFLQRGAFSRV